MSEQIDLTGQQFGRLIVLREGNPIYENKYNRYIRTWHCKCTCEQGNEIDVRESSLKNGHTKSCGCLRKETVSKGFKKQNTYDLSKEYGIGYLKSGNTFLFDIENYSLLSKYYWFENDQGYILAYNSATRKNIRMHRLIMKVLDNDDVEIDHINHNIKDNRKCNLRTVTHAQNMKNLKKSKRNTSGYKGISFDKKLGKWRAQIRCDDKRIHIGIFDSIEEAILARNKIEKEVFGEFSNIENM